MIATRPLTTNPPSSLDRAHGRSAGRERAARAVESRTISTLTQALVDAEHRAMLAEDALEHATGEIERFGRDLANARTDCERLQSALPAIQQSAYEAAQRSQRLDIQLAEQQRVHAELAAQLAIERDLLAQCAERLTTERAVADERVADMHDQAAAAIRQAEQVASVALHGARQTVRQLQLDAEQAAQRATQAQLEAEASATHAQLDAATRIESARFEAQRRVEQAHLEADARAQERTKDALAGAIEAEQQAELAVRTQLQLRLEAEAAAGELRAELEELHLAVAATPSQPAPAEALSDRELKLMHELDAAKRENRDLQMRLQTNERALRTRERDLERERKLADEATRWASRAERALTAPPVVRPSEPSAPAPGLPIASRRRGPRIRVRHGA